MTPPEITAAALKRTVPEWAPAQLTQIAQALIPALSALPETDRHLAVPAIALAMAVTALELPTPGSTCACGYLISPDEGECVAVDEVDYSSGLQQGGLCRDFGDLELGATTWTHNQHAIALRCPQCHRLYRRDAVDRTTYA